MHTNRKAAAYTPRHETGLGRGAPQEGDIILFEPTHAGEEGPMQVYRLLDIGSKRYDSYLLVNGYWIAAGRISHATAKKRFAACWDAYQRVIS